MADGKPEVIRNESRCETTPSCVYYSKGGEKIVGAAAVQRFRKDLSRRAGFRAQLEFKRDMGTDITFEFPDVKGRFSPEELSADVLRALRGCVRDEEVRSAVIAVPAAFGQTQIEATQRAAELAGLSHVELVPEPLAASLAYCIDGKTGARTWLVYDMGGGTFDAVLMSMEEGLMKVVDIAGDRKMGGKDMDYRIVDEILVPYLRGCFKIDRLMADPQRRKRLRTLLKWLYAEQAKISLSSATTCRIEMDDDLMDDDTGKPMGDVTLSLSRERLESLVEETVTRSIDICRELCRRNSVDPAALHAVLLVGGPTYMPCVRDAVRGLGAPLDTSVDPMTAVAKGAAIFAGTRPLPAALCAFDARARARVTLAYPETTVEKRVTVGIRLERISSPGLLPEQLWAQISTTDGRWKSGRLALENDSLAVSVQLAEGQPNPLEVELFDSRGDRVECDPSRFTVLQGIKIGNPPLPLDICLELSRFAEGDTLVAIARRGDTLPATGILRGLNTKSVLRPGVASDRVAIPVYEGEEGSRPLYNRYVGELVITGIQVERLVPAGSDVTVTMKIDTSRRKHVSAYIDIIDQTFEEVMEPLQKSTFDPAQLECDIERARQKVDRLSERLGYAGSKACDPFVQELDVIMVNYEIAAVERDGCDKVCDRMREFSRRLDEMEQEQIVLLARGRMARELDIVGRTVALQGTEAEKAAFARIREQGKMAVQSDSVQEMEAVASAADSIWWDIMNRVPSYWMERFRTVNREFAATRWRNPARARQLIEKGRRILEGGYDESLKGVVAELWELSRATCDEPVREDILETVY
jgi:molecular chaperone DnaK